MIECVLHRFLSVAVSVAVADAVVVSVAGAVRAAVAAAGLGIYIKAGQLLFELLL